MAENQPERRPCKKKYAEDGTFPFCDRCMVERPTTRNYMYVLAIRDRVNNTEFARIHRIYLSKNEIS
jgi:hypothetical protein